MFSWWVKENSTVDLRYDACFWVFTSIDFFGTPIHVNELHIYHIAIEHKHNDLNFY